MLTNATYDLLATASVISKGLHRDDQFMRDGHDCQDCQRIWTHMRQADQQQLEQLIPHLRQHLDRETETKAGARRSAA